MRIHGDPPFRVAVIHGGPGAAGSAAPIARVLSTEFGVLEPFQTADSVDGQVEELRAQLEANGEIPLVLIGHSWGAMLGYILAARYPELVSKLVMVSSGPYRAEYAEQILETRLSRLNAEERDEALSILESLKSTVTDRLARMGELFAKTDAFDPIPCEPERVDLRADLHSKVWSEVVALRQSGELLEMGGRIRRPVIAIHGDYDPHPVEGVREPLSGVLGDFRFITLPNCGHEPWVEREARDEFFSIVRWESGIKSDCCPSAE